MCSKVLVTSLALLLVLNSCIAAPHRGHDLISADTGRKPAPGGGDLISADTGRKPAPGGGDLISADTGRKPAPGLGDLISADTGRKPVPSYNADPGYCPTCRDPHPGGVQPF